MNGLIIAIIIILLLAIIETTLIIINRKCKHEWKVIRQGELLARSGPEIGSPIGFYYISKCEKCGKMKRDNF